MADRERKEEFASLSRLAFDADLSAMELDERAAHGQAQSGPFGAFDLRPRRLDLLKFVEDSRLILRRQCPGRCLSRSRV